MNAILSLIIITALLPVASAQDTRIIKKQDIVYAEPASPLHTLDVYASPSAENAPVVFWIHGGGWQGGDKNDVAEKPRFGHREKFGNTAEKHREYSAVTHVAKGKSIPPFLILHVADHPDTSAQAFRLGAVLQAAGVKTTVFGAKDTNHNKLNDRLGAAGDPATKVLLEFVEACLDSTGATK